MPPHSLCADPAFPFASVQAGLCLLHPREGKANVPTWKDPSDCSSSPRLTQHRNKVWDFGRALLGLFLEEVQMSLGSHPCCRTIHRLGLPLLGMLLCVKGTVTAAKCRREHHSHSLYHALPPTTKHPKAEQQVRKDKQKSTCTCMEIAAAGKYGYSGLKEPNLPSPAGSTDAAI